MSIVVWPNDGGFHLSPLARRLLASNESGPVEVVAAMNAVGIVFGSVSVVLFVLALIALARGHLDWLKIRSRAGATVLLASSVVVFAIAGQVAPKADTRSAASVSSTPAPAPVSSLPLAAASVPAPGPPSQSPTAPVPGTRGIFSPVDYWRTRFAAATSDECRIQGAGPLDSEDAWHVSTGVLACSQDPIAPISSAWGVRVSSAYLYFAPHQDAQHALSVAVGILPADARFVDALEGVNNGNDASIVVGTCKEIVYRSDILAAAVRQANPRWQSPDKVTVTLYTGNYVDGGSDRKYIEDDIHLAFVAIGDEAMGRDGLVHC